MWIFSYRGLIGIYPLLNRRLIIPVPSQINGIFQVRVVLERLANRLACENFKKSYAKALTKIADQIKDSYKRNSFEEMITANAQFPNYITALSQNSTLIQKIYTCSS